MNVHLTKHFESFIREKIGSGKYTNASEVIRAGLRALEEQEKMQELRLQIEKGYAGEPLAFDAEAIKAQGRQRKGQRPEKPLP
ncbi:MAG: type II toxin-antitoxin system ParD family antitoxin [Ferruginibacter sp.]|nr:type II toxin-antitoxin system ParD family antitoxin [Cytophagales bacterium]